MKKVLLFISLLTLMFISADDGPYKLVRLIIVNKSGLPIEVQLTGQDEEYSYYLHIPKGNKIAPTEKAFTVVPDYYTVQPYYIELWDPVYGSSCSAMRARTLDLTHSKPVTIYILPCNRRVPFSPGQIKFGSG